MNIRLPLASIPLSLICACLAAASSAQHPPGSQEPAGPPAAPTTARVQAEQISEYVREVFQDRDGDFWFGTNGDGVCRWDGKSLTYLSVEEGFGGRAVRGILQDPDGVMWFGTNGGVSRFESGIFTNYTVANGLTDNQVWSILCDSAGTIWVGTMGGVCRFDGKSFTAFGEKNGLTLSHVQDIFEDRDGILWFGCSGGLFRRDGESFVNVTRNGPWRPTQEPAPAEVPGPMASFARMVSGEWRVTFLSGTSMCDTWSWGPGEHSMHVQTDGSGAAGEPWRALRVVYWHPGRKQIRLLGLSPFARGVSEGTMEFDGETLDAVFDLHQAGGIQRDMGLRWTFDGPDKYHETLLEATGTAGLTPLNELDYVRAKTLTQASPRTDAVAPRPSKHLEVLESLVGHTWEAQGNRATGDAFHIQSTFEWVPYADYIHARSFALTMDGEPTQLFDAYIYHHTGNDALQCLALSNRGGVHEGDVTVLEGGALQLDLKSYEGDRVGTHVVRFDFEKDGTLRNRIWSLADTERTLVLDIHHRKLESKKD